MTTPLVCLSINGCLEAWVKFKIQNNFIWIVFLGDSIDEVAFSIFNPVLVGREILGEL